MELCLGFQKGRHAIIDFRMVLGFEIGIYIIELYRTSVLGFPVFSLLPGTVLSFPFLLLGLANLVPFDVDSHLYGLQHGDGIHGIRLGGN